MDYFIQNNIELAWLIAGLTLILIDIIFLSLVGLIFIGLGCLSTSLILSLFHIYNYQFEFFGIISFLWFFMLYKYMVKYKSKSHHAEEVRDIIGSAVVVVQAPLLPNSTGSVKWSGVIFLASLDSEIKESAPIGSTLLVKNVEGNKLICTFHKKD